MAKGTGPPPRVVRRLAALIALLLAVLAVPAGAQDPRTELKRVEEQITLLNGEIAAAKAEKSAVAQQVSAARAEAEALVAALAESEARVEAARNRVTDQQGRLDEIRGQLGQLLAELAATLLELRDTRYRLRAQAVDLYIESSAGFVSLLVGMEDAGQAVIGFEYAANVVQRSGELLDTLRILERQEERQQVLVEEREAEAAVVLAELQADQARLEEEAAAAAAARAAAERRLAGVQALLNQILADIRAAEQHKQGLEAESKRLQTEIAALSRRGGSKPGLLAWPVDGPVSSGFGYRIHPIFETRRLHTGIDIDAATGTPIRAAANGVVILAELYGGYGRAVVIDHGGSLSTLYAHQSKMAVGVGREVDLGEVIGYVGCTGYCTGPHLHFETREDGVPVDPMKYLEG